MILLYAVILGFAAGFVRARANGRSLWARPPGRLGLLFVAALLQALAFYIPATRQMLPGWLAAFLLVGSQIMMLVFVGLNRTQPGFLILGLGLAANLLVIIANEGWMPVSPQVLADLFPESSAVAVVGERVGWSKDILLLPAETHLWWLSDRFILPAWFPQRAAFSLGDILIAIGAFWALWVRGGPAIGERESSHGAGKLAQHKNYQAA